MRTNTARGQRGLSLIEVLVTMTILSIVSTVVIMGWIDLQRAYTFTVNSNNGRQQARDTMARMVTEIRDVQIPTSGPYAGQPPITIASSYDIRFFTSYGASGGNIILTRYRYRLNASTGVWTLYRQRDTNGNYVFDSGDLRQVVATNIVNQDPNGNGDLSDRVDMFTFSYYDQTGNLASTGATYTSSGSVATGSTAVSASSLGSIVSVNIRLISDINPKHAPVYLDLRSTVQPRNLRQP